MERKRNPICNQVWSLRELVETQIERSFDVESLEKALPIPICFDIRRVIITGAGDSYAAALAMVNVFGQYADVMSAEAYDPMTFNRYMLADDIGIGEPNSPLVIGISAGGRTSRITETMAKANALGAYSMAVTNAPDSPVAKEARAVVRTQTASIPRDFPGLRSYFANLVSLVAIVSRMGLVRGVLEPEVPNEWQKTIANYMKHVLGHLEKIDESTRRLAAEWKDFTRFDFIGDDSALASAMFGQEKIYECVGEIAYYDDSEDWCHINYFIKDPETVGTVVYVYADQASFSRLRETIWSALQIGRPVLVITDDAKAIDPRATVIELPDPPVSFEWLRPLVDYIPTSLLAGYIADAAGKSFFNSYAADTWEMIENTPFISKDSMTITNSSIDFVL